MGLTKCHFLISWKKNKIGCRQHVSRLTFRVILSLESRNPPPAAQRHSPARAVASLTCEREARPGGRAQRRRLADSARRQPRFTPGPAPTAAHAQSRCVALSGRGCACAAASFWARARPPPGAQPVDPLGSPLLGFGFAPRNGRGGAWPEAIF